MYYEVCFKQSITILLFAFFLIIILGTFISLSQKSIHKTILLFTLSNQMIWIP